MTRFLTRIDTFLPVQKGITDFGIKFNHEITPKIVQTKKKRAEKCSFYPQINISIKAIVV